MKLSDRQPLFIGFKLDGSLRRRVEMLTGPERKYVSSQDSTFLTVSMLGDSTYVGKVIDEKLTTDRVDDVRRNVLSIVQRLFPDVRLPVQLEILTCVPGETPALASSTDEATQAEV